MKRMVIVEVIGLPIMLKDNVKAFGVHGPIEMDVDDIFTCISKGAEVYAVDANGKRTEKLNFTNYNKIPKSAQPVKEPPKPVQAANTVKPPASLANDYDGNAKVDWKTGQVRQENNYHNQGKNNKNKK